jgi:hypothetical protein
MGGVAAPASIGNDNATPVVWIKSRRNGNVCHEFCAKITMSGDIGLAARIWEYLQAAGVYWWAVLAVFLAIERLAERAFPTFWQSRVDPWFTPHRRKQTLMGFAILAFVIGNFRAWDEERTAKEHAIANQSKSVHDPGILYENGFPVSSIIEPTVDLKNNLLSFPAVKASKELNFADTFEFRNWQLACSGQPGSVLTFGAMKQITYPNFICKIEGTR